MIHGVEDRRYPVAHKLKGCCRCTLCGHQFCRSAITLIHFRIERQHVKLTTQHRLDDAPRLCFHDGVTVHELGVIELRSELQSGGTVALAVFLEAIVHSVDAVEGRQHIIVVEGDFIEFRGVEVNDDRHHPAVSADGASHGLLVHDEIFIIQIDHITI